MPRQPMSRQPTPTQPTPVLAASGLTAQTTEALTAAGFDILGPYASPDAIPSEVAASVQAVAGSGRIGADLIDALPALKVISVHGVGYDGVDVAHATARGVIVTHTPDVLSDDVADLALGLTLAGLRRIGAGDRYVRAGQWGKTPFALGRTATGLAYGLVGFGRIGRAVANRLRPLAGSIAYTTRRPVADAPYPHIPDLIELARISDVLIVTVPGGASTRGLISAEVMAALGPQGLLVNVARGEVVDQTALIAALDSGALGGAALDVFDGEPEVPQALMTSDACVLTPHIGSATFETRRAMADLLVANLAAVLNGRRPPAPVPESAPLLD